MSLFKVNLILKSFKDLFSSRGSNTLPSVLSKIPLDFRVSSIEKTVKPSCMWGVAGEPCNYYYTQEHSFIKIVSYGIIPLCVFIFSIWYIIKIPNRDLDIRLRRK